MCKFMNKLILIIVFWQPQECRFVSGESILMCKPNERAKAEALMTSELPAVKSCLQRADGVTSSMKRAILEVTFTIVHNVFRSMVGVDSHRHVPLSCDFVCPFFIHLKQDGCWHLFTCVDSGCLQIIVSGVAQTVDDVERYARSTLLAASMTQDDAVSSDAVRPCIQFLLDSEFITRRDVTHAGTCTSCMH